MRGPGRAGGGRAFVLPSIAVLALVAAVAIDPRPALPIALLPLLACSVAAALYRPWSNWGLGLAAAGALLATEQLGIAAAGLLACLTNVAAGLVDARLAGERRARRTVLGEPAASALAALAGAGAFHLISGAGGNATAGITAGIVYLATITTLDPLHHLLAGADEPTAAAPLERFVLEAFGVVVGLLLGAVATSGGSGLALALYACLALFACEGVRQRMLRRRAESARTALERLGSASQRLAKRTSPIAELVYRVHRECRQVVPFDWFHFELDDADGATASWRAGPDGEIRAGAPQPPAHPPALPGIHKRADWKVIERTLESGGQRLGHVRLWCDPRRIPTDGVALLDQLVDQLSSLVHRAVLDRQARQDPLTGVALRRVLDQRLAASFERCCELGGSVAVVLVDLDFFKRINDTYSHAAGDAALVALAQVLSSHLRDGDVCARYGGEEFTLLLEDLTGAAALRIAERLRREVEEMSVEFEGERLPLTLSAGIAAFPEIHCGEASEVMQLADAALYMAKELGRNRCFLHRGRGRFEDADGRLVETDEPTGPVTAPTIFA